MKNHPLLKIFTLVILLSPNFSQALPPDVLFLSDTTIQEGDSYNDVTVRFDAIVDITGGIITGQLRGLDSSDINIWGGELGYSIDAWDDSQITISGIDFFLGGQNVSGTLDLNYLTSIGALTLNTDEAFNWQGHLTGVLSDDSILDVDIWIRHLQPIHGGNDTANFILVPEPASSLILIAGALFVHNKLSIA